VGVGGWWVGEEGRAKVAIVRACSAGATFPVGCHSLIFREAHKIGCAIFATNTHIYPLYAALLSLGLVLDAGSSCGSSL